MEENWQSRAACVDADPELFFPVGEVGSAGYEREVAQAKSYCARCPVWAQCLADAVRSEQVDGVFGGTTPEERRTSMRAREEKVGGFRRA